MQIKQIKPKWKVFYRFAIFVTIIKKLIKRDRPICVNISAQREETTQKIAIVQLKNIGQGERQRSKRSALNNGYDKQNVKLDSYFYSKHISMKPFSPRIH